MQIKMTEDLKNNNICMENISRTNNYLDEITSLYNSHFINSPHSKKHKQRMWNNKLKNPIILVLKSNSNIIGFLESWNKPNNPNIQILVSILVVPKHRKKDYAILLFNEAKKLITQNNSIKKIIVHFRDSKKKTLEPFYEKLGFSDLKKVGDYYNNPEIKWELSIDLSE